MNLACRLTLLATLSLAPVAVHAQSAGDWTLGFGASYVVPSTSDVTFSGISVTLEADPGISFTAEYFLTDALGIEIFFGGSGFFDDPNWLPPVVGLNYHFHGHDIVTPFVGVGVNYGAISTADAPLGLIEIKHSFGLALHAGVDVSLNERDMLRFSARYVELDFRVNLGNNNIGSATLEPVILGLSYVRRF